MSERPELIATRCHPKVTPFHAAQVALSGARKILSKQVHSVAEVSFVQRRVRPFHVPSVGMRTGFLPRFLSFAKMDIGLLAQVAFAALGSTGAHCQQTADNHTCNQDQGQSSRRGNRQPMPTNGLLEQVKWMRWTRRYGPMLQVAVDVGGKLAGSLISPRTLFIQALHHDPIQIP